MACQDCQPCNTVTVTPVTITDLCAATVPTSIPDAQTLEELRAIVAAQQEVLCALDTGCLELNKATTYVYEPFQMYFYDLIGVNRFVVPTGTQDATATVISIDVEYNGVGQPESGSTAAAITGNGYSFTVNLTDLEVTLDNAVGFAGSPHWVKISGFVRKSLEQISGC